MFPANVARNDKILAESNDLGKIEVKLVKSVNKMEVIFLNILYHP
jgi:hypothetical protein